MVIVIPLLMVCSFNTNDSDPLKILWTSDYKLSWEDFQGDPDTIRIETEECVTKTRIEVTTKISESQIEFQVPCYFEKDKSWADGNVTDELLNHEQVHFDIAEIYARTLRRKLAEIEYISRNDLYAKINDLYHEVIAACVEFQMRYDKETNHSKNTTNQRIWNERVSGILDNTNDYKSIVVFIDR